MNKTTGVYRLDLFGYSYVGKATDFEKRQRQHKGMLCWDAHHSSKLQNAWNVDAQLALNTITFTLLEECSPEVLEQTEQKWINTTVEEVGPELMTNFYLYDDNNTKYNNPFPFMETEHLVIPTLCSVRRRNEAK